jgi:hypothetical protein
MLCMQSYSKPNGQRAVVEIIWSTKCTKRIVWLATVSELRRFIVCLFFFWWLCSCGGDFITSEGGAHTAFANGLHYFRRQTSDNGETRWHAALIQRTPMFISCAAFVTEILEMYGLRYSYLCQHPHRRQPKRRVSNGKSLSEGKCLEMYGLRDTCVSIHIGGHPNDEFPMESRYMRESGASTPPGHVGRADDMRRMKRKC